MDCNEQKLRTGKSDDAAQIAMHDQEGEDLDGLRMEDVDNHKVEK